MYEEELPVAELASPDISEITNVPSQHVILAEVVHIQDTNVLDENIMDAEAILDPEIYTPNMSIYTIILDRLSCQSLNQLHIDTSELSQHSNLYKFIYARNTFLETFTLILWANILYSILNPFNLIICLLLLYNISIVTKPSAKIFNSAYVFNICINILIILINIFITSTLYILYIKYIKYIDIYIHSCIIAYLCILYLSTCIICLFNQYIIINIIKLKIIYRKLTVDEIMCILEH